MRVYKKHGTKEKLFEMMSRVNKVKLNEAIDTDKYENVVFMQGEEADKPLEILNNQGEDAALEYLKQWHDYGHHEGTDQLGHGSDDNVYEKDGYIMAYNPRIGYIGLQYEFPTNENFDSPKTKDEKYLNKGGDKKAIDIQPDKYDGGVREPRERDIQVKDDSLKGLKGDDEPLEEVGFSDDFVPHGTYTISNAGGYEIMLSDSGDAAKVRDAYGSNNPQTSDWLEIEYVDGEPVIDPNGYDIPLNQVMRVDNLGEGIFDTFNDVFPKTTSHRRQGMKGAPTGMANVNDQKLAKAKELMDKYKTLVRTSGKNQLAKSIANDYKKLTGYDIESQHTLDPQIQDAYDASGNEIKQQMGRLPASNSMMSRDNPNAPEQFKDDGSGKKINIDDLPSFGNKGYSGTLPTSNSMMKMGESEDEDGVDISTLDVDSEENGEKIEGGLADDKAPEDFDPKQILLGMEVEMEHTNDPREALEIAMDHLVEDPEYYGNGEEDPDEKAQDHAEEDAEEIEDEVIGTEEESEEEAPEKIEDDDLKVNMNWLETIKPKGVDDIVGIEESEKKKDSRLEKAGVEGYNKPKRTPNHPTKSHIVVAKEGDKIKTIRFGEQGAKTAGDPKKGESEKMKKKRKSFKARHGKNIAKGKMSAAYWADKVKW